MTIKTLEERVTQEAIKKFDDALKNCEDNIIFDLKEAVGVHPFGSDGKVLDLWVQFKAKVREVNLDAIKSKALNDFMKKVRHLPDDQEDPKENEKS